MQNLASSGFSCWHFGHFMIGASTMYFLNENMHGKAINRIDMLPQCGS
jgi:hypothetical protein